LERISNQEETTAHPSPDTLRQADHILLNERNISIGNISIPGFQRIAEISGLEAAIEGFGTVALEI
jgi:hypothetical protein